MEAPVQRSVARTAPHCYSAFCDIRLLPIWVPGLKSAKVVRTDGSGRALEVLFAFGRSRSYSLIYSYVEERLEVSWTQGVGKGDGVRGSARFESAPGGCVMTYALEFGSARSHEDNLLGDPSRLLDAFAHFMESGPR